MATHRLCCVMGICFSFNTTRTENSQLLAFELASGKLVWQAKREAMSWSSPILAENKGRTQLILTDSKAVEGYDPTFRARACGEWNASTERWRRQQPSRAALCLSQMTAQLHRRLMSRVPIEKHCGNGMGRCLMLPAQLPTSSYLIMPTPFGAVTCLDVKTGKALVGARI